MISLARRTSLWPASGQGEEVRSCPYSTHGFESDVVDGVDGASPSDNDEKAWEMLVLADSWCYEGHQDGIRWLIFGRQREMEHVACLKWRLPLRLGLLLAMPNIDTGATG